MGKHRIRILGTTTLVALVVGTTQALAGGLAIREQSAWGEGASYAGVAAGGSVSAMFWNPATMTQTGKFALENSAALIFPAVIADRHQQRGCPLGPTSRFPGA